VSHGKAQVVKGIDDVEHPGLPHCLIRFMYGR